MKEGENSSEGLFYSQVVLQHSEVGTYNFGLANTGGGSLDDMSFSSSSSSSGSLKVTRRPTRELERGSL